MERIIGRKASGNGPTLLVMAGIHGNETAGVVALESVFSTCDASGIPMSGEFIGIRGNTRALAQDKRYIDEDLNRAWRSQKISQLPYKEQHSSEEKEVAEILQSIAPILNRNNDQVTVLDLHSYTAEDNHPFCVLGDTLSNRSFAYNFPLPIILGLDEYIEGTFLEYVNKSDCTTLGFEGGSHYADETIKNCIAIVWVGLAATGIIKKQDIPEYEKMVSALHQRASYPKEFFHVRYRYDVKERSAFNMIPGYKNFMSVKQAEHLATDQNKAVLAKNSGLMLMPLYQGLGNDGFFIISKVQSFWLFVSYIMRYLRGDLLFHLIPGIHAQQSGDGYVIYSMKRLKKFWINLAHLLGFRWRRWEKENTFIDYR